MEEFINKVPGQQKALKNLSRIYKSQRIPHAFLFTGKSGTGKHFAAIEFTKLINGIYAGSGSQHIAKSIESLTEPYVRYIFPLPRGKNETGKDKPYDKLQQTQLAEIRSELNKKNNNPYYNIKIEKASNIKITSIRDIKRFAALNFSDVKWRMIIISEAEKMSVESQNALLKSLEEPSEGIIFILLAASADLLLPTIKSRCWSIEFSPLSKSNIVEVLTNRFSVNIKDAENSALFADGSVTTAINLLENDLDSILKSTITILRFALARRYFTAYQELDNYIKNYSSEIFILILKFILLWIDDILKDRYSIEDYYFEPYKETIIKFNEKFKNVNVIELYDRINFLIKSMDKKVSLNLIALNTIFEIGTLGLR